MKIFLTGTSGFLGSHTAEELVRRGHSVTALVRKSSQINHLKSLPLKLVEGALPDCKLLKPFLEEADAVVHVAGIVKAKSPEEFFRINALGTQNLVQEILVASKKPKLFIYISTIAVHGPEDGSDFCLPSSVCHPLSAYGKSKLRGEMALSAFQGKVRTIILRPPVLYGPRDQELLPLFKAIRFGFAPLFGSGKNSLSLCYASDVARAIADLVEKPTDSDEIFCLDDGASHTWKSIVQTLSQMMKKKTLMIPIPPLLFKIAAGISQTSGKLMRRPVMFTLDKVKEMEQPDWVCGYEKLKDRLGWNPQVSLTEGAEKTLTFYQREGWIKLPSLLK
jgi:nucleoside-diphosphate-sugar epimerase